MNDDDDDKVEPISDADLSGVVGGRRSQPTTVTGKFSGNDTIVGVSNDTLFAGSGFSGADTSAPTFKRKK